MERGKVSEANQVDTDSIGDRARSGVAWSGVAQVVKQVSDFGVGILLARLLDPKDFGIVSASAIFLSFVSILTSFGFSSAIVQRATLEDGFIKTAQTLSVVLGCCSALVMTASALWIAEFYNIQFLEKAIPIMSLVYIVSSFSVIPNALLTRNLNFEKMTQISMLGTMVYAVTALIIAFAGFGVWSLIISPLVSMFVTAILQSYACSYLPRFGMQLQYLKELVKFGGFVTVSSLMNHAARNVDNLIIGRYFGADILGLYARAYNLATIMKELVVSVLGSVLFPSFSRMQNNLDQTRKIYFKSINLISLISLPVCLGMVIVAPEFITTVYGTKWVGATRCLQILGLSGFVYILYVPCTSLLIGLGKVHAYAKLQVIYSMATVLSVLLVYTYGIESIAFAISTVIVLVFVSYELAIKKILNTNLSMYWRSCKLSINGSLLMLVSVLTVKFFAGEIMPDYLLLMSEMVVGVIVYSVFVLGKKDPVAEELKKLLLNKFTKSTPLDTRNV